MRMTVNATKHINLRARLDPFPGGAISDMTPITKMAGSNTRGGQDNALRVHVMFDSEAAPGWPNKSMKRATMQAPAAMNPPKGNYMSTSGNHSNLGNRTMNAVIIYDDSNLAAMAYATIHRAMRQADTTTRWNVRPWRMDMLKSSQTAETRSWWKRRART